MEKTFYLVSSYDKEHGDEVIGLFDNEEQAETAAALEELKIKDDEYVKRLSRNTYQMFDGRRVSEKWYVDNLMKIYESEKL